MNTKITVIPIHGNHRVYNHDCKDADDAKKMARTHMGVNVLIIRVDFKFGDTGNIATYVCHLLPNTEAVKFNNFQYTGTFEPKKVTPRRKFERVVHSGEFGSPRTLDQLKNRRG